MAKALTTESLKKRLNLDSEFFSGILCGRCTIEIIASKDMFLCVQIILNYAAVPANHKNELNMSKSTEQREAMNGRTFLCHALTVDMHERHCCRVNQYYNNFASENVLQCYWISASSINQQEAVSLVISAVLCEESRLWEFLQ